MSWTKEAAWTAGPVWVDAEGRKTYYIRQRRGAKRYHVTTKARTVRGAMRELERFEKDPEAYRPAGSEEALLLTPALIARYRSWCESKPHDPRWLRAKELHLDWWQFELDGKDLARVTLTQILEALEGSRDRAKRIVTIKHLYAYLRQTDQLDAGDDPTLDALPVPQAKSSQDERGSKVIDDAAYEAVLPLLPAPVADACRIMRATGIHLSEVARMRVEGEVLTVAHKGGHDHRMAVDAEVAAAARRLLGAKLPSRNVFYRHVKAACEKANVEPWTPGRFRHSFATRAVAGGANPQAVALYLGHRSAATTLKWYSTTAVAPMVNGR